MLRLARRAALLCALLLPRAAAAAEPESACAAAAATAERAWTLPAHLIHAIGQVESGRYNPLTGRIAPWPWTVNANGNGLSFASRTAAVAFVRELQSRGVRLIDVGCFQVDLFYHPAAFASLEQAFDPAANADYAARFLTDLHGRTGSWAAAVAGYHSAQPLQGETYRRKVMLQWQSAGAFADTPSPTGDANWPPNPDRFVVLMSAAARAIHVIGPGDRQPWR